jgi:hypothetical protein
MGGSIMATIINAGTTATTITPDTSGQLTLQASGITALTANTTGYLNFPYQPTIGGVQWPAFSAYNNATQSISSNTLTKILFQVEDFDTNNNFASSRFTPTIAGYYQINAGLNIAPAASGVAAVAIYKNGNEWQSGSQIPMNGTYSVRPVVSTLIYFNGSTDYVEIYGLQISGGSLNVGTNVTIATWFTGSLVRGA